MQNNSRERAVSHLQNLYTVVVGIALTAAISSIIDIDANPPIRTESLPYFFAYLVTLVPIYHGALRHLDLTYFETTIEQTRAGALMIDWSLLFIESCGLLALALLVGKPLPFMITFSGLLAFDAMWAFIAHLAFSPKSAGLSAETKWSIINAIAVVLLIMVIVFLDALDSSIKPLETYRWVLVLLISTSRTIVDYAWCWSFYYPNGKP